MRMMEDSSYESVQHLDKVAAYMEFKTPKDKDGTFVRCFVVLEGTFPNLSRIAPNVLAIPKASAASEWDFSTAGFIIQERRTQLNPETVDDIFFLHSNQGSRIKCQLPAAYCDRCPIASLYLSHS